MQAKFHKFLHHYSHHIMYSNIFLIRPTNRLKLLFKVSDVLQNNQPKRKESNKKTVHLPYWLLASRLLYKLELNVGSQLALVLKDLVIVLVLYLYSHLYLMVVVIATSLLGCSQ